ncbi:hypothetical protein BABINDRAFT_159858 [Babjeviella inositovora NRRL Y-12698]|uniref:Serine/threonine-protein kinase RIO1 n=1 Tax=Babjeviella inositovora NRRL Y-12698 TaxID=984486 RepID=A0A1E3QVA0_9ASCO|nr:uncharacterized protein BABINDRAFT_159858 [Babjeviella inositovora NRRL Y-12698]ODQ81586.1 hypothetical protein BABINDRAFT_159858 [Babjeviella inositovora NRRL Y-12698]
MSEITQHMEELTFADEFSDDSDYSSLSDLDDGDYATNRPTNSQAAQGQTGGVSGSGKTLSAALSKSPQDKAQILAKYGDRIKTGEMLVKQEKKKKDKSDRATVENVLDPRTLNFLVKLIRKGVLSHINGCLSTGKEANVYHGVNTESEKEYAVKIYKTSILVFKDRERYVDGEYRFRNSRNQSNPRKMIKIWAEKEFRNLKRLHSHGIPVPEPIDLRSHVLVMEFLTRGDGEASPKLRDYEFANEDEIETIYQTMLIYMRRMFQKCRLVHADLSEYNSLMHEGQLYIIDVSQSVEPEHPMSLDFLRMDIKNINDFFGRQRGAAVFSERVIFSFITEHLQDVNDEDEDAMRKYIKQMPRKGDSTAVDEDDEVFRSVHLVRSLNHLEERDFGHMSEGKLGTFKSLVDDADGIIYGELKEETEDDSEEDDFDESDEENTSPRKAWVEREPSNKGKKNEDKGAKKERKKATKDAQQEKRKTKMKKHLKKKLVNKSASRK